MVALAPDARASNASFIELLPIVTTPQPLVQSNDAPTAGASVPQSLAGGAVMAATTAEFIDAWLDRAPHDTHLNVQLLTEREARRDVACAALCAAVKDHLVGVDVLARMRFPRAAAVVDERLPRRTRIRSGDLAEIIATEYVSAQTEFRVPLKRLRYKDDREMSMRGDDIIGLHAAGGTPAVLKGEVKSRASLSSSVVGEACTSLAEHRGRPKPETLAFIAVQLWRAERDEEAEQIEHLLNTHLGAKDITHLVFTLSGNDPAGPLAAHAATRRLVSDRRLVGLRVADHQTFIRTVFEAVRTSSGGDGGPPPSSPPVAPPDATAP
jgi:hypothetical protein